MGQMQTRDQRTDTIRGYFGRNIKKLESHIQGIIKPEAFLAAAMTSIQGNSKLLECRPESLFTCLMESAQLRLVPGKALGHAYLVPYKNTCTFILGYRGMIELALRGGKVRKIEARTVHEGDDFDFGFGFEPFITHRPSLDAEPKTQHNLVAVYAVATLKDGTHQVDVLRPDEIEAARKRSQSGKNNNGPWGTDYLEMARKTAVRRLSKYLPLSTDAATAIGHDEERDLAPRDVVPEATERAEEPTGLAGLTDALTAGDDEPWPASDEVLDEDDVEDAEYEEVEEAPKRTAKKKAAKKASKKKAARRAAPASNPAKAKPEPSGELYDEAEEAPAADEEAEDFSMPPWDDEQMNGGYIVDVNSVYDTWQDWMNDQPGVGGDALRKLTWLQMVQSEPGGDEHKAIGATVNAQLRGGMGDAPATLKSALVLGWLDARR